MNNDETPSRYLLVSAGVVAFGAAGLLLSQQAYKYQQICDQAPLADNANAAAQADALLQYKCADCHGINAAPSPMLDKLSGGLQTEHITNARKAFTLEPSADVRSGLVDYLKMDRVLSTRRMPPASYSAVHLGSRLTPFDVNVLRQRYRQEAAVARMFSPVAPAAEPADEWEAARIRLGHKLYNDTRLSIDNTVACATCHDLCKGGTDNKPKSDGVRGADGKPQQGGVNAPTVYNAAGHIRQFWDGRAADLQEQAGGPPLNPVEMGYSAPEDWNAIAAKLEQDPELVALFAYVYGNKGITGETITNAIAAYEQTLVTPNSVFDLYLKGNEDALNAQQKQGLNDFVRLGCATCHSGPALGGISFENINTHGDMRAQATQSMPAGHGAAEPSVACLSCHTDIKDPTQPAEYVEGAHGLADHSKNPAHTDMFRVPTLRNVALTAPYFHTGTVQELADAVRIMISTQNGTTPTQEQVDNITAFLKAQTGCLNGTPLEQLTPEQVKPMPAPLPQQQVTAEAAPGQTVSISISIGNGTVTTVEKKADGTETVTETSYSPAAEGETAQ